MFTLLCTVVLIPLMLMKLYAKIYNYSTPQIVNGQHHYLLYLQPLSPLYRQLDVVQYI